MTKPDPKAPPKPPGGGGGGGRNFDYITGILWVHRCNTMHALEHCPFDGQTVLQEIDDGERGWVEIPPVFCSVTGKSLVRVERQDTAPAPTPGEPAVP